MKACVRKESVRARSCQETVADWAFMDAWSPSEGRRSGGADDLTRLASDIAETMGQLTREIISLSGSEHARRSPDGELDAPADHHAGLLAVAVRLHSIAGGGPRRVALVQQRQLPPRTLGGDEAQRDLGVAELDQLLCAEEGLRRGGEIEREELGERHRHAVEHLLQGADRRAHPVLL